MNGGKTQLRHRVVVPDRQPCTSGGPIRQHYAGVDFILQSGIYEFGYGLVFVEFNE
jgi:hypothetical protein